MIHEILPVGPLQCNCSILGDEASHEAMVIDPGADVSQILAIVARHGLQVKQIVVTHAHLDHIGGAMELKRATGAGHCRRAYRRDPADAGAHRRLAVSLLRAGEEADRR